MTVDLPPPAAIVVTAEGSHWRFFSADGLLEGRFTSQEAAVRAARAEAEAHTGYVVTAALSASSG